MTSCCIASNFPSGRVRCCVSCSAIGSAWNISLFHYRNHGSDYGRVLAGIEVPKAEREEFLRHLNELHYPYTDETGNAAYRMFLGE